MKKSDFFSSAALKAGDFPVGETFKGKIIEVIRQSYKKDKGDDDVKPFAKLQSEDQLLPINATNWDFLVDATGFDDSDDWCDLFIEVTVIKTRMMGKPCNGFEITRAEFGKNDPKRGKGNVNTKKVQKPKKEEAEKTPGENGDELPF